MDIEIVSPAPVLNIADFSSVFGGQDGKQIAKNARGLPIHFEFVALPHMQLTVIEQVSQWIARVSSKDYPSSPLFLDVRFSRPATGPINRPSLPSLSALAQYFESLEGTSYVWGGNHSAGIPRMLDLYPPSGPIDASTKILWTLQGVDCSGLLFEASGGSTPRNTSQLVSFGLPVPIAGKSLQQIFDCLRPMDFVVWPGHVWYVLDRNFSIESRFPMGVIRRPLIERLEETLQERTGVDAWALGMDPKSHFVIRRLSTP